jgi:hypothetical protein
MMTETEAQRYNVLLYQQKLKRGSLAATIFGFHDEWKTHKWEQAEICLGHL